MTELLSYGPFISRKQAQAAGIKYYYTGKACKNGHLPAVCKVNGGCPDCRKDINRRNDARRKERALLDPEYREHRRLQHNATCAKYRQNNPDKVLAANRAWEQKPEVARKRNAATRLRQTSPEGRAYHRGWKRARRESDPSYRIASALRARTRYALTAQNAVKSDLTEKLLGCTFEVARAHVEAQFLSGMTWDNYDVETWHVDHIRPCISFDLTDPSQQKVCFNFRNLCPLWAADNRAKSGQWTSEMEAEWAKMMRDSGYKGELFLVFAAA